MSSSNMASCNLKGCTAAFINNLAIRSFNGEDISENIKNKAVIIVDSYNISECTRIIVNYGDFHDVYVQLQLNPDCHIAVSNKLMFHKQIAYIYIKEIIETKVKHKVDAIKIIRRFATGNCDSTCSICLSDIKPKDAMITSCNHIFHKDCMSQWQRNTCPMCRSNI